MYINNIFIVYDNGLDWVVYLKSVENVITLGKLIGLLLLFCLPLLSILSCNGNHFSKIYMLSVCRYVVCLSYVKLTA